MASRQSSPDVTKERDADTAYCLMETLKYFGGARRKLLSSRMSFAASGEQVVGPDILTVRRFPFGAGGGCAGVGAAVPILGRIDNSPDISLVVKRYSDQKVFGVLAQRQTIRDVAGCTPAAGQIAQQHGGFDRQSMRRTNPTALRTHHQRNALRR
jgi:hypothetical protein